MTDKMPRELQPFDPLKYILELRTACAQRNIPVPYGIVLMRYDFDALKDQCEECGIDTKELKVYGMRVIPHEFTI